MEGKDHKEKREHTEQEQGTHRAFASGRLMVELPRFIEIGNRRGHKENCDVEPVGRFSNCTVVGVKNDGNEHKTEQRATQLDAPKILAVAEEKALYDRKNEHGPKEQLHVLPGRFIYAGKGREPSCLAKPIVQEMQKRAAQRSHRKPKQLKSTDRSFHIITYYLFYRIVYSAAEGIMFGKTVFCFLLIVWVI